MSAVYDNWERLVGATLRREQLRLRALRSFSDLSLASSSSFNFNLSEGEANEEISLAPNYLKIFSFAELKSATGDFGRLSKLDGGVFERVYKGWIDENTYAPSKPGVGIAVTVKWFDAESGLDLKAWQAEIEFLGKSSHPNIVKLLGYCLEDNRFLLVSEDMQQESLEDHLFRSAETLSWRIRMKIAIGAARALAFLHTMGGPVIHRNINAANIWLDGDYNAKLSYISFVRLGDIWDEFYSGHDEKHPNFIRIRLRIKFSELGGYVERIKFSELCGYVASKDANIATSLWTRDFCMRSEVHNFGLVLLQIVSGRRAFDPSRHFDPRGLSGEQNLVKWARPLLPDKSRSRRDKSRSRRIMDPKLEGQYPSRAVLQVAKLINKCLQPFPEIPPPMKQVLETLEQIGALKMNSNGSKSDHKSAEKPANHRHLKFQLPPLRPKYPSGTTNRT